MRDPRQDMVREIRRVDAELMVLRRTAPPDATARIDAWLDRRSRLMARRDQPATLGFTVTDNRRVR